MTLEADVFCGRTTVVTGGLGLIGSFLTEQLVECGARVVLIDDESKGTWRYMQHLRDRVDYRKGSLEDREFTLKSVAGMEYVFHLASRAYGVGYSHEHHLEMFRFNDLINTNVLDAMVESRPAAALVVSSSCVYPDDGPSVMSDREPITGQPEKVNWGYGMAKRVLEEKTLVYSDQTGIPITVVRPTNVYGERYNWAGDHSQALPMITKRVLDGDDPLVIWGTGKQRRNYVHASDCARNMLRLVAKGYCERPVNIGSEQTVSIRELAEKLVSLGGLQSRVVPDPSKPEGRFVKSADSGLLEQVLGVDLSQEVGFAQGLERMIRWYVETFPKS